jgi:hypothetical protein
LRVHYESGVLARRRIFHRDAFLNASRSRHCWSLVATTVLVALVSDGRALAEEIRISADRCSPEVHLVARDAHVSAILKRLAERLQFQLRFDSADDPLLSIDTRRQLNDLLVRLAPTGNLVTSQTRDDPRCPDQLRILEVWVLPEGQEDQPRPGAAAPQAMPPQPTPEQARLPQEADDEYLKAHGFDPEGQPPSQ